MSYFTTSSNIRILITGGAGFIGSRLVKSLQQNYSNHVHITIFDNLHPQVHGPNAKTPVFFGNIIFLRGDISNPMEVEQVIEKSRPSLIYHLAAETGTGQSYDEPSRYAAVNVMGTAHLIEAIRKKGGVRKVILAASRAVYGEGAYIDAHGRYCAGLPRNAAALSQGCFDVPMPAGYKEPGEPTASRSELGPSPASVYASTKLMQEYLLTHAGENASWNSVILRFQNVYGPGQSLNNPYTGVLSIFSHQLLSGNDLSIFEDGLISRDFVYVQDVVDALIAAGNKDLPHGTILDIGLGRAATILEAAQLLMGALGKPKHSYRITGDFRLGDIRHACADITTAKSLLNWAPKVELDEGLTLLAKWAKQEYQNLLRG